MFLSKGLAIMMGGLGILTVEVLRSLNELTSMLGDIDLNDAKVSLEMLRDQFALIDTGENYLLYEEVMNGNFKYIGEFDNKFEVMSYVNDMKVTIRGK